MFMQTTADCTSFLFFFFLVYAIYQKLNLICIRLQSKIADTLYLSSPKVRNQSHACLCHWRSRFTDKQHTVLNSNNPDKIRQVKHLLTIEVSQGLCMSPTAHVMFLKYCITIIQTGKVVCWTLPKKQTKLPSTIVKLHQSDRDRAATYHTHSFTVVLLATWQIYLGLFFGLHQLLIIAFTVL